MNNILQKLTIVCTALLLSSVSIVAAVGPAVGPAVSATAAA